MKIPFGSRVPYEEETELLSKPDTIPAKQHELTEFQERLADRLRQLEFVIFEDGAQRGYGSSIGKQFPYLKELRAENPKEHDSLIASNEHYKELYKMFPDWTDKNNLQRKYEAMDVGVFAVMSTNNYDGTQNPNCSIFTDLRHHQKQDIVDLEQGNTEIETMERIVKKFHETRKLGEFINADLYNQNHQIDKVITTTNNAYSEVKQSEKIINKINMGFWGRLFTCFDKIKTSIPLLPIKNNEVNDINNQTPRGLIMTSESHTLKLTAENTQQQDKCEALIIEMINETEKLTKIAVEQSRVIKESNQKINILKNNADHIDAGLKLVMKKEDEYIKKNRCF